MFKNLYNKIFRRKQYKESLKIMDKLLGIEKSGERIDIFHYWFFDSTKVISLINYKNVWDKSQFAIQYNKNDEYFIDFNFNIKLGYYDLSYLKMKNFKNVTK